MASRPATQTANIMEKAPEKAAEQSGAAPEAVMPTASAAEWLNGDLKRRVAVAAESAGMSLAALCEQWVREGLERFEAHHAPIDPDGSGRCSLRTGSCTIGPVPLPVQQ
jgi:hypothetical protein